MIVIVYQKDPVVIKDLNVRKYAKSYIQKTPCTTKGVGYHTDVKRIIYLTVYLISEEE